MKQFLITRNSEYWDVGVDTILNGGVWLRKCNTKKRLIGYLMSFELSSMKEIGSLFLLKHLYLDKIIKKKRDFLTVHMYKLWGKKLREVERYINEQL